MTHTPGHRPLTDAQMAQIAEVRALEAAFIDCLHALGGTEPGADHMGSRDLAIALSAMEAACMRAVRHITRGG